MEDEVGVEFGHRDSAQTSYGNPSKTDCVMFFGPVVPDGYGICYNPVESHINFSVSAYNSCAETNAARLAHYLEKALLDMRTLLQGHPRARL